MEFSVDKSNFAEALEQLQGAVDRKNTIPILSHCLVEAEPQGLRLAATDLELGIRLFCPAQVKVAGSGALPARRLLEIVKSLADGDVCLRTLENHWVQVICGRSTFKLAAMPKDNFPAMPDVPPPMANVPAGTLRGLIDRTAFAISQQEGRYNLNAALLLLKPDRVEMVATDGSRLPLAGWDGEVPGLKSEERLLIPKRALGNLRRVADAHDGDMAITIGKDESHLFFSVGDSVLMTRQMVDQFPNYEAAIPKANGRLATVDAASFRAALERVSLLAPEGNHGIALSLESGQITLSATSSEAGEAIEPVDATYQGEPLRVGFNSQFLKDFLSVVKAGSVVMALKDEQSATEFRPADNAECQYRYIVMPMRF